MNISGVISEVVQTLPERAEQMSQIVDNFYKEKFQEVIKFAKAANGGRNIQ